MGEIGGNGIRVFEKLLGVVLFSFRKDHMFSRSLGFVIRLVISWYNWDPYLKV